MFAIHAMQWPGSIPRVLFVGVPLRAAVAWINSARVCIRGPLALRSNIQNQFCALLQIHLDPPGIISEFPTLAKQLPESIAHVLCDSPPHRETFVRMNSARVFEFGVPPCEVHTHMYMNHTHNEKRAS